MNLINLDQLYAANKATVDALLAVANTALASAERISALNLNTARSAVEDSAAGAKAVLGAKDAKEALAAQAAQLQPAIEKAVAYSRSAYDISAAAQQEVASLLQAQFNQFQKTLGAMLAQATQSAPGGSAGAVSAMQAALDAANTAFANMNALGKQFAEMAQSNVAEMNKATAAALKKR